MTIPKAILNPTSLHILRYIPYKHPGIIEASTVGQQAQAWQFSAPCAARKESGVSVYVGSIEEKRSRMADNMYGTL